MSEALYWSEEEIVAAEKKHERKRRAELRRQGRVFDVFAEGHILYAKLPRGKKQGRIRWGQPENRHAERPAKHYGNFMGIPQGNLVVFDIDPQPGGADLDTQVEILCAALGIDTPSDLGTLAVLTPKEGAHIYVLWDAEVPVPKPGKDVLKHIDPRLTGDIRSSASNSYVLIPGSEVCDEEGFPIGHYSLWSGANPAQLSHEASANISELLGHQLGHLHTRTIRKSRTVTNDVSASSADTAHAAPREPAVANKNKVSTGVPASRSQALSAALSAAMLPTYHQKRAWVARAMSCCYSDADLLQLFADLDIDIDSNGGSPRRMEREELLAQLSRLDASVLCGAYCGAHRGSVRSEYTEALSVEQATERKHQRERSFSTYRNFQVLDPLFLAKRLSGGGTRKPGKSKKLAYRIAREVVSPNLLLGRTNIILSIGYLTERFEITRNQADRALRELRGVGFLRIHRKQYEGSPTLYRVGAAYIENGATSVLNALIADSADGGAWSHYQAEVDFSTGEIKVWCTRTGSTASDVSTKLASRERATQEGYADLLR